MARKKKVKDATPSDPLGFYVEFETHYLRDRLALFKHILVRRAIRKDTASYHFTVQPGGATTVAATDLENRLQFRLEVAMRYGYGTVMIDAHALNALIAGYAERRVRIHLDDQEKVRVEGLQTRLTLPGYDPEKELKATAEGSLTKSGWLVRGDYLAAAIEKTRPFTDPAATRYALGGIAFFFPEPGTDRAEFVATDGRRLSLYRVPVSPFGTDPARVWRPDREVLKEPFTYPPILACKVVPLALKLAREAGTAAVGIAVIPGKAKDLKNDVFEPGTIQVVTRDAVLTTRIVEGRYPRFRDVWPTDELKAELRLDDASQLGDLLGTVVGATDFEHKGVEMVLAGGCLMMTVTSETKGKAVVSLLVPDSEGSGTFDLDALMLRQFFDVAGHERLRMRFYGADKALVLQAGPNHEFVIMPITRDTPRPKPAPKPEPAEEPEAEEPGGDDGGAAVASEPEPVPVAPVAVTPDAHRGNGKARRKK